MKEYERKEYERDEYEEKDDDQEEMEEKEERGRSEEVNKQENNKRRIHYNKKDGGEIGKVELPEKGIREGRIGFRRRRKRCR